MKDPSLKPHWVTVACEEHAHGFDNEYLHGIKNGSFVGSSIMLGFLFIWENVTILIIVNHSLRKHFCNGKIQTYATVALV